MSLTLDEFTQRLLNSGLMAQPALADFLSSQPLNQRPNDGKQLAKLLVRRQKLTKYQAQQIYAGRMQHLVLGNYVILDKLGQGGMGLVLKALHRRMERVVALKILSPELVKEPLLKERFQRETKAAARLEHPHIVTAFDADEAEGIYFFVMQYVDGEDLAARISRQGPCSVAEALDFVIQAASGLDYAHRQGVIHRDIKPANLLLQRDGLVKILDMGLARIENSWGGQLPELPLTDTGAVMGTVDYMPPEQALNSKHADARSDQYSLGITMFFLLTGKPAYSGTTAMEKLVAHREAPLPSLARTLSLVDLPEAELAQLSSLDVILHKMIAKQPERRYALMSDVIKALRGCQTAILAEPTGTASVELVARPIARRQIVQPDDTGTRPSRAKAGLLAIKPTTAKNIAEEITILGSRADIETRTFRRKKPVPQRYAHRGWMMAIWLATGSLVFCLWLGNAWLNRGRNVRATLGTALVSVPHSAPPDSPPLSKLDVREDRPENGSAPESDRLDAAVAASSSEPEEPVLSATSRETSFSLHFVKRLAAPDLQDIVSLSMSRDGSRALISGNPVGFENGGVGTYLVRMSDGELTAVPNSRGRAILLPDGDRAILLRVQDRPDLKSRYSSDFAIINAADQSVIWDVQNAHDSLALSTAVSSNGRLVLSSTYDSVTKLWDTVEHKLIWETKTPCLFASFDRGPSSRLLMTTDWSMRQLADATQLKWDPVPLPFGGQPIHFLDTSRRLVLVGCGVGIESLHVMDWPQWKTQRVLDVGSIKLSMMSPLPDGQHVITGAHSGEIAIWSLRTGRKVFSQVMEGEYPHSNQVKFGLSALMAEDGRTILTYPPQFPGKDLSHTASRTTLGENPWIDLWQLQTSE